MLLSITVIKVIVTSPIISTSLHVTNLSAASLIVTGITQVFLKLELNST